MKHDFGALFCYINDDKVDMTYYEMNNIPELIKKDIIKKYQITKIKNPSYFVIYDNKISCIIEYDLK